MRTQEAGVAYAVAGAVDPPFVELSLRCSRVSLRGYCSRANVNDRREVVMPVWAWVLIIVLLVLLLTGGVYVRR